MDAAATRPTASPRGAERTILAVLLVAGMVYAASQTAVVPSIPTMKAELDVTAAEATLAVSAFVVSAAATTGITGRLGDMYGRRRVLVAVLALFAIGGAVSALATTLVAMVAGRVIMGAAGGVFPLAFAIIRQHLPPERVVGGLAAMSAGLGVGAGVGLVVGGLVTDHVGHQGIFWLASGAALLTLLAAWRLLPPSAGSAPARLDVVGALLLAGGVGVPVVAISQTASWGWLSAPTLAAAAAGMALLLAFALHERRTAEPLIDMPTLLRRPMLVTNLATVLIGFGLFGCSVILSQFVQEPVSTGYGLGVGAAAAGMFLLPGSLLMFLSAPVAGRLSMRRGPRFTLVVGALVASTGPLLMALLHAGRAELYVWASLLYLGNGIAFGALPALALRAALPQRAGEATGLNTVVRYVGSSFGVQVAATLVGLHTLGGEPLESGYTLAFSVCAAAGFAGAAVAATIPVHTRRSSSG